MKDNSDSGSTVPRRQLGRELRKLRMEAGLTVEAASQRAFVGGVADGEFDN